MATATTGTWVPEDTLANRLILVRLHLGLTHREAAEQSGLTYGEWQSMEAGRQARAVDLKVAAISSALGVDRDWLLWGGPLAAPEPTRFRRSSALDSKSSSPRYLRTVTAA